MNRFIYANSYSLQRFLELWNLKYFEGFQGNNASFFLWSSICTKPGVGLMRVTGPQLFDPSNPSTEAGTTIKHNCKGLIGLHHQGQIYPVCDGAVLLFPCPDPPKKTMLQLENCSSEHVITPKSLYVLQE